MKKQEIFNTFDDCVMKTYTRTSSIFVKGKGMKLIDIDGKEYLDFFPGWGVSNVGHCHPKVMAGVRDQIGSLIHMPNNFYNIPQAKLAKEIIYHSFAGKVFFGNSGAEACEAAVKFARAYGAKTGDRYEVITTLKSFHGRTLGAMNATGQEKIHSGFGPNPEGFKYVPFNDFEALEKAVTDQTVLIAFELIQGEGGINVASQEYVEKVRKLCDEKNILLAFDEVQTGMGRLGTMFGYQHYGIEPDLMMLAKALGGGLPIGALVAKKEIADTFEPGMHGSTFGGSPLVCKAALGVFKAIQSDKMLANVKKQNKYLMSELKGLESEVSYIKDIRGIGLMIGVELNVEGKQIFDDCFENGLIINCTQGNVLRLMPALNVTKKQIDQAIYILEKALKKV